MMPECFWYAGWLTAISPMAPNILIRIMHALLFCKGIIIPIKGKLGEDFYNYKILGACNPPFAYQVLLAEDKIGAMLPCNIIVQEKKPGTIEVSAINPIVSMKAVLNKDLHKIAAEIKKQIEACFGAVVMVRKINNPLLF
ncbi:DUF302 domain-containing protein [Chitinophaga oryzae]|uniref:DUF302 domain-containing protein n=2 Tax=Chitinophaga oryzae TaxID=2725414 RepID=A0ABX6LR50_9BACT|nr:DUF302 domain-containing protein [Chitinophaga oryzae]